MKRKNTQPLYIFNRENPQNSEPQNGPRRGLDFIALLQAGAYVCLVKSAMCIFAVECFCTYLYSIVLVGKLGWLAAATPLK